MPVITIVFIIWKTSWWRSCLRDVRPIVFYRVIRLDIFHPATHKRRFHSYCPPISDQFLRQSRWHIIALPQSSRDGDLLETSRRRLINRSSISPKLYIYIYQWNAIDYDGPNGCAENNTTQRVASRVGHIVWYLTANCMPGNYCVRAERVMVVVGGCGGDDGDVAVVDEIAW